METTKDLGPFSITFPRFDIHYMTRTTEYLINDKLIYTLAGIGAIGWLYSTSSLIKYILSFIHYRKSKVVDPDNEESQALVIGGDNMLGRIFTQRLLAMGYRVLLVGRDGLVLRAFLEQTRK